MASINSGSVELLTGSISLNDGLSSLYSGTQQLVGNNSTLVDGMSSLYDGAKALDDGASTLQDGISTLKDGTNTLVSNNDDLIDGSVQLADGANKISDGSSKLYDGSSELGDGLDKLYDGSDTLATALGDGAKEVKDVNINDNTVSMFASPVESNETKITTVENNGSAMAAYMMSVGLWVACLAYCIMFSPQDDLNNVGNKSAFEIWSRKGIVLLGVAIGQAILMILLLNVFNGFSPEYFGKTILVASVASVAFMAMFYFFNLLMGKVGSFLLLVFMVLQLSGSAGTYPIELSDSFYQNIHKYMPFTYTVDAFRSTIANGLSINNAMLVLMMIFVVFSILSFVTMQIKVKHIKDNSTNVTSNNNSLVHEV